MAMGGGWSAFLRPVRRSCDASNGESNEGEDIGGLYFEILLTFCKCFCQVAWLWLLVVGVADLP